MAFRAAWIPRRRKEYAPLEYGSRVATIIAELDKARKGITLCFGMFLALAVGIFPFSERVLQMLVRLVGRNLVSFSPEEGFLALASLSAYCAFVLTLPAVAFLLWRGAVLPRIPAWRKWSLPVFATATALFLCGVLLGYFIILPAGIGFLVGFETGELKPYLSVRKFIAFCGGMLIALGLAFEMPLLSFFLARLGWLKTAFFMKHWRMALIGCTVLSAVITPTPDIYNMGLMLGPLLGLYFVSFLVVMTAEPGRR